MERAKTEEENTNEVKDRYHEVLAPYFFCFRLFFWGQFQTFIRGVGAILQKRCMSNSCEAEGYLPLSKHICGGEWNFVCWLHSKIEK